MPGWPHGRQKRNVERSSGLKRLDPQGTQGFELLHPHTSVGFIVTSQELLSLYLCRMTSDSSTAMIASSIKGESTLRSTLSQHYSRAWPQNWAGPLKKGFTAFPTADSTGGLLALPAFGEW